MRPPGVCEGLEEAIETMRALASCLDECEPGEIGVIVKASCLGRCQKPPLPFVATSEREILAYL